MSHLYFNDIKNSLNNNKSFNFLEDLATTYLEGKFNLQLETLFSLQSILVVHNARFEE